MELDPSENDVNKARFACTFGRFDNTSTVQYNVEWFVNGSSVATGVISDAESMDTFYLNFTELTQEQLTKEVSETSVTVFKSLQLT